MYDLYENGLYYLGTVWNRRWLACLVAAVVCLVGWVAVILIPDTYQSSVRIYVDTSNVLRPLLTGITVENNIAAQVRMIQQTLLSRPNLEEVARVTDYDLPATSSKEMDRLLTGLKRRTTITASRENLFSITYTDSRAQRSHDVVVALQEIFVESNIGESREELDAAQAFIDDQLETYEGLLRKAENRRADFKRKNMRLLPVYDSGQGGYLESAASAQTALKQIDLVLKQAIAKRNVLRRELASVPESLPADFADSFRLLEAEAELQSLLSRYTENHPDVIATQRKVDELLVEMTALVEFEYSLSEEEAVSGLPNPLYNDLKLLLIEQNSKIGSLQEKENALRQEAERLSGFAGEIPLIEAQLQQLDRDYEVIKRKHGELLNRRESARLSRERDKRGGEVSYRLIEPPAVPTEPVGPNRPLMLSGVLGLGLIAGIAFALALDLLDSTFSSVKDLRQRINLPVYGRVLDVKGFTTAASSSADLLALFLFVMSLLSIYLILMAVDSQGWLRSLSLEQITPELLINTLDPLRTKLSGNLT